jgi:hypothetical protein
VADSSIDQGEPEATSDDLAVAVGTLEIEGVRPKVGDTVDLKVTGTIRKLVDETAFVSPSTINDQPMPPKVQATDEEELMAQAQRMDATTVGY